MVNMVKNCLNEGRFLFQCQFCVGEIICWILFEIFLCGDLYDFDIVCMLIIVGEVWVIFDLWYVIVFVLLLGGENKEECFSVLCCNSVEICYLVVKGMLFKFVFEFRFELDEIYDCMDVIK